MLYNATTAHKAEFVPLIKLHPLLVHSLASILSDKLAEEPWLISIDIAVVVE